MAKAAMLGVITWVGVVVVMLYGWWRVITYSP